MLAGNLPLGEPLDARETALESARDSGMPVQPSNEWQRVRHVFEAALQQPDSERAAFVARSCADAPSIRDQVIALLASHDRASRFLETPAGVLLGHEVRLNADTPNGASGHPPSDPAADKNVGRVIGSYRIESCIGHGGMGAVYRAVRDDDAFRKTVALKLVRGGRHSEYFERRFLLERKILAGLQHPNIATVLDGGTTDAGEPYLVMEYVEGQPITEYCTARAATIPDRVALFRIVCGAVQYAHQNLVIHRDIKPANVMVDAHGVPKLLDFGIAKLLTSGTEADSATMATMVPAMTPEYASPEQVKGQTVTTASDVYSLGVLLYELLAGRRPYDVQAESLTAIVKAVCETEPVSPSEIAQRRDRTILRGDLDTIVMKALRKEPKRRYQSAGELSEDLRRYLEGRPVTARTDTVGYRVGKFVRRNRVAVTAAVLIATSLVGGIVATTWQARLAERRFDEARRLIRSVIFDIQPKLGAVPGTTQLRKELIESTLEYLVALSRDAGDDPRLLRELTASYVQLARVQGIQGNANVGDIQAARRTLGEAEKLVARLSAIDPDGPDSLHEAAVLERYLALSFLYEAAYAPAREHAQRAVDLAERAVKIRPDFQAREDLADTRRTLANCTDSAEEFARSQAIYESLLSERPDEARVLRNLSQVYKYAAGLYYQKSDERPGLDLIRKAHVIDEKLLAADPDDPQAQDDLSFSLNQLSWGYSKLGDLNAALAASEQSLAMRERMVAQNPGEARAQERLGYVLRAIALLRRNTGDRVSALRDYQRAHAIYTDLRARGYGGAYGASELGSTELELGDLQSENGHIQEACRWYRQSAGLFDDLAARGALRSDSHEEAEKARRAAAACGH
jgi:tetratricopeptide (TPR) repeat protein/tRNA A-37 threonylcarbamoyl transferase component Bud32